MAVGSRREDEAAHGGAYRTKDLILGIDDRTEEARVTGDEHRTVLDPPPGKGLRHAA
ncbi:hypothetical protein LUX12_19190 [Streptomyces somaliensis]|uniref:hypothetical protein n=1 Tax=Streptomyces somaliensis TaxID=78355 RepID=UPI0020CF387E|nr:hypothetical protein [Streptomyces somaliensis]MCP9946437.1 hypothetical protein [Streptomyces somaliensis]MCP9960418.1 hypothetical protein [Streptomyces somaliensis]MCP9973190.1 hypothetical protein [Streptomyces somaliensis]